MFLIDLREVKALVDAEYKQQFLNSEERSTSAATAIFEVIDLLPDLMLSHNSHDYYPSTMLSSDDRMPCCLDEYFQNFYMRDYVKGLKLVNDWRTVQGFSVVNGTTSLGRRRLTCGTTTSTAVAIVEQHWPEIRSRSGYAASVRFELDPSPLTNGFGLNALNFIHKFDIPANLTYLFAMLANSFGIGIKMDDIKLPAYMATKGSRVRMQQDIELLANNKLPYISMDVFYVKADTNILNVDVLKSIMSQRLGVKIPIKYICTQPMTFYPGQSVTPELVLSIIENTPTNQLELDLVISE